MTCVFSVGDETHVAVQRSQRVFAPDPSVGGSIGAEGARSALPSVYILLAPRVVAYARSDAIGWGKYCKIHRTSGSSTAHRRTRTASPNPRAPTVTLVFGHAGRLPRWPVASAADGARSKRVVLGARPPGRGTRKEKESQTQQAAAAQHVRRTRAAVY